METRFLRIFKRFKNRLLIEFQPVSKTNKDDSTTDILVQESWSVVRNQLFHGISFLFFGFLLGNLFGTFLALIRMILPWDGFIVIIILFFMELISYSRYHSQKSRFLGIWKPALLSRADSPIGDDNKNDVVWNYFFDRNQNTSPSSILNKQSSYFFNGSKACNSFKIGFLLGFFIDAYKVGS